MSRTLILVFHHDLNRSKANAALAESARQVTDVDLIDMQALYPSGVIDDDVEVERLLSADRLVLQFPVQWYSTPALLKTWQNTVLTRMFYIAPETEGRQFEGTPLLVAATAGNVPEAYSPRGINLFPLAELLKPLQSTASRCALPWSDPFILHAADKLSDAGLRDAGELYAARLRQWIAGDGSSPQNAQSRHLVVQE